MLYLLSWALDATLWTAKAASTVLTHICATAVSLFKLLLLVIETIIPAVVVLVIQVSSGIVFLLGIVLDMSIFVFSMGFHLCMWLVECTMYLMHFMTLFLSQMVQYIIALLRAFVDLDWQLFFLYVKEFFVTIGIFILLCLEIFWSTILLFVSGLTSLVLGLIASTYALLAQMVQYVGMLLRACVDLDWQLFLQYTKEFFVAIGTFILHSLEILSSAILLFLSGLMSLISSFVTTTCAMLVYIVDVIITSLTSFVILPSYIFDKPYKMVASGVSKMGKVHMVESTDWTMVFLIVTGFLIIVLFWCRNMGKHIHRRRRRVREPPMDDRLHLLQPEPVARMNAPIRRNLTTDSGTDRGQEVRLRRNASALQPGRPTRNAREIPTGHQVQPARNIIAHDGGLGEIRSRQEVGIHHSRQTAPILDVHPAAEIMQVSVSRLEVLEKELERERELKQCVVCLDRPRKVMIIPCNHYCLCQECERQLDKCPICTKRIRRVEKIFDS